EITFGVLLPITSRGLSKPEDCISNLQKFVESLRDTTKTDRSNCFDKRYKLKVYIGIDKNDAFFHPIEDNCAKRTLMEYGIPDVETMVFDYPPGSICAIWRGLARRAYDRGCQYTVLFGDDVVLKTIGWMSRIDDAFHALAIEKHVPYGFDGDPYLFQLYRRWGCSVMLPDVKLTNTVGGEIATRYEKKHHQNWTFEILDDGVNSVQTWLEKNSPTAPPRLLTLDVIIPSYRVQMKYLEPIIRLNRSPTASTMIIIIVDNPESPNINVLKDCYEQDPFVRIRVHNSNMGASQARNRGLGESAADYILFLDDDVTPDPDILLECEKVIRQYPNACGFIGCTKFPDPTPSIASSAITMWGGTFFWDICEHIEEDIPWGVTANLLARRYKDNVWFDEQFPKTGGGEDIDYCLKKKRFFVDNVLGGEGFRAAPQVKAIHPWWNNGGRVYRRFMKWAAGDGALINMYPELTYRDAAPNTAESLLGVAILALMTLLSMTVGITAIHRRLLIIFLITIPLIPVANIIFDVHHHMFVEPTACVPALRGYRRILAAAESSVIRIANDWGRLEGHIRRKEWSCIGQRFDWFAGRRGGVPIAHERSNSVFRFLILVGLVTSVASWVFA
ncbi:nucleotide-diphospho-sugar transferase, partial [Endogone sp. FLAS-F59071]